MRGRAVAGRSALLLLLGAVVILATTPFGVWVASRLGAGYARTLNWQVTVDSHHGALATGARLDGVHVRHDGLGLRIDIDELGLDPWAWHARLLRPHVRWQPDVPDSLAAAAADSSSAMDDMHLPIESLPAVDVEDGELILQPSVHLGIRLRGVQSRLAPDADADSAALDLSVRLWHLQSDSVHVEGELRSRWRLQSAGVDLRDLYVRAAAQEFGTGTLRGSGDLSLASPWAARARWTLEGEVMGLQDLWLDGEARGGLAPLALAATAEGAAEHLDLGPLAAYARVRLDCARIHVDTVAVDIAGGRLHGSGAWAEGPGFSLLLAAERLHLADLPLGGLGGLLTGHLGAQGHASAPELKLTARVDGLSGIAAKSVDLALLAHLREGRLAAQARSPELGQLAAEGNLDLLTGAHDLALTGRLDPAVWIGRSWPLTARGRLSPDTLSATLRADALPFGEAPPGPVQIQGVLAGFRHLDTRLSVGAQTLEARLRADLGEGHLDTLSVQVGELALDRLSSAVSGALRGHAGAAGPLGIGARGGASLAVDDLQVEGWRLGPTSLTADTDSGVVRLAVDGPGLRLTARLDTSGVGTVDAALSSFLASRPREGGGRDTLRATGTLAARGDLQAPADGTVDVAFDSLSAGLGGWSLQLARPTRAAYAAGDLRLDTIYVDTPLGHLRVRGATRGDSLSFDADIDSLQSPGVEQLTVRGAAGLRLRGVRDAPQLRLRVALRRLDIGGRPLGQLTTDLDLSDSLRGAVELLADSGGAPSLVLSLTAPAADFQPKGRPTGLERARLHLEARGLDASSLATYVLDESTRLTASLTATIDLPASQLLSGPQWADVTGVVELQALTLGRERARLRLDGLARAQTAGGRATLEGFEMPVEVYRRDTDSWDASGQVSMDGDLAGDSGGLTVRIDSLDLRAASLAVPGRLSLPAGSLSLQARLTGTTEAPALNASADIDLEVLGHLGAQVSGQDGGWQASATWTTTARDSLRVTGTAPASGLWPRWDDLRLHAHSPGIDLSALLEQVPELETLGGNLRVDLRADSLVTRPRLDGAVEVEDLEFSLLGVTPGYRFAEGRVLFGRHEDRVARAELTGFDGRTTRGDGRLALTGHLDLMPSFDVDYEMRLVGQDVRYTYEDVFDAPDIDLDLDLRGDGAGALLAGNISLRKPVAETQLVDLTAPPIPPPPAVQSPILENTRLDVYIDLDRLQTRSELSDVTLQGRVRTYGSFYKPRFQGELEVTQGTVVVLNRQFTFTQGRIVLDQLLPTYSILDLIYDPLLLDPELDLEAVAKIPSLDPADEGAEREVTLTLQGPARSSVPQLTSPGLGSVETVRFLAFGSITETNYTNALATAAGQLLLSRQVQRVGVDEFLLLPSGTSIGSDVAKGTAVRVGKYITWPVPIWLRYEALTAEPSTGLLEAEYRVNSWLKLDARGQSRYGTYGLGIGVSRDY